MKHTSSIAVFSLAVGLALPSLAARVPYANDFSTRTSGLSPSDRWMEMPYSTGPIAYSYSTYSYRQPYYKSAEIQDGWAMKGGYCSDKVSFTVADDNGNQGLVWAASVETGDAVAIVHPLGNEFTTGFVKVSVDILTPDAATMFGSKSPWPWVALSPVFRPGLDLEPDAGLSAPLTFGPGYQTDGTSQKLRALAQARNAAGDGTTYAGRTDSNMDITAGRWYRYEAVINLAARTYRATFTDLGTAHPTPQSTGTSKDFYVWYNSVKTYDLSFATAQTSEVGGIAGLILRVTHVKKNATAGVDNMFVAWRATADEEWTSVYENDFTTRRYRSLGGTTAGAYALAPTSVSSASASYGHGTRDNVYGASDDDLQRLVPDYVGVKGALEPTGVDGWRRFEGRMRFGLVDPNKTTSGYGWKNGAVLRATATSTKCSKTSAHAFLSHPIGTELTSGKVRLYFDLMAPGKWQYPSDMKYDYCGIYLGSAVDAPFITGSNDAKVILTNKVSFGAGYYSNGSEDGGTSTATKWSASGATVVYSSLTGIGSATPVVARWYRFRVTADLDAKTFDVQAYLAGAVGPAMTDASCLTDANRKLDVQGRDFFASAPAKIDSVIVGIGHAAAYADKTKRSGDAYYVGNYPLIDSIRVCRVNDDGSDGAEIYSNDFENCTRTVEVDSAVVGVATDRPGADGWTARGVLQNKMYATGENPAVVLNGSCDYTQRILQPMGVVSKGAAEMTVVADMRPPRVWAKDEGTAMLELGDDEYGQGNLASARSYLSAPRIAFGFREPDGQAKKAYGYTNCCFAVTSADGTTLSDALPYRDGARNWYRFKATLNPLAGTFAVAVYDQGAAQPTAVSADGELVATFSGLPLPALTGKGFTTLGLTDFGVAGSRGFDANDPDVALVDNLSVDSVPFGMSLLIR